MTTTATPSTALAAAEPVFSNTERLALAGFLAGYTGLTREAYALDLRQFASWCQLNHVQLFGVRRADIECFSRDLEAKGRARATVTRRLCTIAGFYKYAVEEELLDHSPAEYARARDSLTKVPATPVRGSARPARSRCACNSGPTRSPRSWVLRPERS